MISIKYASIIAVATFMAGTFIASPELRAYAAATIGSAEIIDESIQSVDIKNGQVMASDIGTDAVGSSEIAANAVGAAEIAANAVGASEIAGVGDLLFAECTKTSSTIVASGNGLSLQCDVNGAGSGDVAIATMSNRGTSCFAVTKTIVSADKVTVTFMNTCSVNASLFTATIAIVVFDTAGVIIIP